MGGRIVLCKQKRGGGANSEVDNPACSMYLASGPGGLDFHFFHLSVEHPSLRVLSHIPGQHEISMCPGVYYALLYYITIM